MPITNKRLYTIRWFLLFSATTLIGHSTEADAVFLDANGHYLMQAETRTAPGMSGDRGLYQALDQNFRLEGEVRLNDHSSFFLEFKLFDDPRAAFLGDTPKPRECDSRRNQTAKDCEGSHQNTIEPGYADLTPKVTKVYVRYAFENCIVEAGRRGRDWGLGVFLDSGTDPFDQTASVFDGISCDVNMQKSQNLGFSFGFDKLSETGTFAYSPYYRPDKPSAADEIKAEAEFAGRLKSTKFGANARADDHDQFFFTLDYDTTKGSTTRSGTYKIGIYFANVLTSKETGDLGSDTNIKFIDIFSQIYWENVTFENEFLLRQGKSSDPNLARLGGKVDYGAPIKNNVQSFAIAGKVEWTLASAGTTVGPEEYKEGNASRHLVFLDYAIAPGSQRGYFSSHNADGDIITDENVNELARGTSLLKSENTSATAFHENYKPALIFFNGRPQTDYLRVDGIFDPNRVMNVSLIGLGYRYEDMTSGNFEFKLITGQLSESMPSAVRDYYLSLPKDSGRPIGFYGKDLGYELDFKYWKNINRQIDLGLSTGYTLPGNAWRVFEGEKPKSNFLAKTYIALKF